ncbi:uncharacterized protein LOC135956552 [Calliphora vicina]|uniref:uncharacterized protein LOC135956552 n=1 Tax=Calliphora vicina TaxID=7373 RepID=UPI00325A50C5
MFTNWLTGTTGLTNSATSSTSNANSLTTRLTESNNHLNASSTTTTNNSNNPAAVTFLNSHNNLSNLNSNIMSSPPDIVLEVGPAPSTIRFMAHGLVLGMHSGYLRSAIRLDERGAGGASNTGAGVGASNAADIIVYLTNVTAEQFAPLLTYMYTGYLDLNVENIFGVLLATHVLHMPRALEICRSYLARAQTEGYFGPNNTALNNPTNNHQSIPAATTTSGKIIRPIASKPPLANFGFLPITHQPLALNPITPATTSSITSNNTTVQENKTTTALEDLQKDEEDDIEVDEVDKQSLNNENQIPIADDEEEDVEVFIDSNSEAEVVIETQIHKMSFKKLMENKKLHQERESSKKSHHRKSSHHNKSERRRKGGSSGLQVAKAPIPASQLDTSEANKVIIDVASCDGPVRFKRILNTAYGHKPEACNSNNHHSGGGIAGPSIPERSLQSVSLSFHQQMAKTISQQQQLQQAEESENSETSNGSLGANVRTASDKASSSRKIQSEVFVCVYCKHTFKSQYCYQKHAKRHLNPLTLQATCVPEGKSSSKEESAANGELQITKHQNTTAARPFYVRNTSHYPSASAGPNTLQSSSSSSTCSEYLRREVRPLDMNVQYYPCKTCGCKFPSYYFVHKHRKMCHAEEEAQQSASDNNAANTTAVTTAASINPEECLNTQNSD